MQSLAHSFVSSFRELKNLRSLCIAGMLTALSVCLGMLTVPIGQIMRFSFGFIAVGMLGLLYGPVVAGLCAGISDILSYVLFTSSGGPFFPGYTVSAVVGGIIYGIFLYRKRIHPVRIFFAMLTIGVFVNLVLNGLWLSIQYGYGFWGMLPGRLVKNCISVPLNTVLFYGIAKALEMVFNRIRIGKA